MSNKTTKGRLPHIYTDNWIYFLTARTVDKKHHLNTKNRKQLFLIVWNNLTKEYNIKTYHWILWSNHYHALVKIPLAEHLPKFINRLHASTTRLLNKEDDCKGRKIWNQYWDHCVRSEIDFWRHFNYIVNNPVKHGWCSTLGKAFIYPYSGNPQWQEKRGDEFLYEMMRQYPVKNFIPEEVRMPLRTLTG